MNRLLQKIKLFEWVWFMRNDKKEKISKKFLAQPCFHCIDQDKRQFILQNNHDCTHMCVCNLNVNGHMCQVSISKVLKIWWNFEILLINISFSLIWLCLFGCKIHDKYHLNMNDCDLRERMNGNRWSFVFLQRKQ